MTLRSRQAIAIFGGTFDPVHYGHLRAAEEAREQIGIDDFRLLPAGVPVLRPGAAASAQQRLEMLRLALEGNSRLRVDDREVRRAGPSYMVDTLAEIRAEAGPAPLLMLLGQDAASALDRWHEWERLFELAHLVVMRRPGTGFAVSAAVRGLMEPRLAANAEDLAAVPAGRVLPLETTQLDITATAIRSLLARGRSVRYLLPERVIGYIRRQGLYTAG